MEEGSKSKKTVFVGGLGEDIDEAIVLEAFAPFGDVIDVQLPLAPTNRQDAEPKHRGFAFVTYSSTGDAQDAIDNMDLNELRGRVLKVNLARPTKGLTEPNGNRAVWESEDWLKQYAKPLAESGGLQARKTDAPAEGEPDEDEQNAMED
ncbi:RNA-binding domain-containing protein [Artomyces pyxidatus]|uniref:RNA-binding domain-containing protein n=1 Tax=Artomyces pyxidatus TaxID=48021 RepID=A0ACB8T9Y6_9AGAM|nr:RNA-binding domain-containing protein [Artomyces pyxidatus]